MEQGQIIDGRYGARQVIGEGGMGQVRLCYDRRLPRQVAIKTVPFHDRQVFDRAARFLVREAQMAGALSPYHRVAR